MQSHTVLQGATGSELGGLTLKNASANTCVVHGPLRLVLLDRAGRKLPLADSTRSQLGVRDFRLAPGRSVAAMLWLDNACKTQRDAHLWVILARGEGKVDLGLNAEGRCDSPNAPPFYALGGLISGDKPKLSPEQQAEELSLRLDAAQRGMTLYLQIPAQARAGTTLEYTVVLQNQSSSATDVTQCPLYYEQLWLYKHDPGIVLLSCFTKVAGFRARLT